MTVSRPVDLLNPGAEPGQRFAALVGRYERPVFNAAFRMLGSPDEARDVAQTAFLKALENLHRFDPRFRFFSWLYRIAMNEALDQLAREAPPKAELVKLRYFTGLSVEEAAAVLGISRATAAKRFSSSRLLTPKARMSFASRAQPRTQKRWPPKSALSAAKPGRTL